MEQVGRCAACGLAAPGSDGGTATVCSRTCAREAEHELRRLIGRRHQLEGLRVWRETAGPWELVLHPSQRREADDAVIRAAEVQARIDVLDRALTVWSHLRAASDARDALAPRPARDEPTAVLDVREYEPSHSD